ncbi:potassium/proton antiporter [Arsenicicoccus piscis]|uniref:potassium/proton antiporter n=1 Tax=Arsenicicoccus piscis TaxID=673954 RepID=UPI001F4C547B|nr:potassium/proton antiporter [Arsenicicoccus piscis]MCH8628001.1 potassium/proton antiporter [Arsenicicoccus piscis]
MGGGGAFGIDDLSIALLLGGLVLLLSVVAVRVSVRSGLPSLLLYLAIGLALGVGGLGIPFDNDLLTQVLGYTALVLILAEGGLTTSWPAIKPSVRPAALLSTVGVVVSIAVTGTATHLLLDLGWEQSFLVGAILSSTDAAAVFSVLRTVPLPRRITGMLEAESGFNDAPVVMMVLALSHAVASSGPTNWWEVAALAGVELVVGAAVGAALGWLGGRLLAYFADTSSALFSIAVMAVCVIAYAAATLLHTSGFIAVYLAGLVLGNMALPHRQAIKGFSAAVGWLAQIGLFVLLGLLATPSELLRWVGPAFFVGLVLLLVARPLSILVSLTPFRVAWRDRSSSAGRGCAAPCPSCSPPSRSPRVRPSWAGCSTWCSCSSSSSPWSRARPCPGWPVASACSMPTPPATSPSSSPRWTGSTRTSSPSRSARTRGSPVSRSSSCGCRAAPR